MDELGAIADEVDLLEALGPSDGSQAAQLQGR